MSSPTRRVAVCGGGVMGLMTAHYLVSMDPLVTVSLFESAARIADGASGRAGGFLAKGWSDATSVGPLSRRGFDLHASLAGDDAFSGRDVYGYRECSAIEVTVDIDAGGNAGDGNDGDASGGPGDGLACGPGVVRGTSQWIGEPGCKGIAQLEPRAFSECVAASLRRSGRVEILTGKRVTRVSRDNGGDGSGYVVHVTDPSDKSESHGPFSDVVFCLGPWTHSLLPGILAGDFPGACVPNVAGRAAFSVVFDRTTNKSDRSHRQLPAVCAFLEALGCDADHPEIYPRPGNLVYLCCGKTEPTHGAKTEPPAIESVSPYAELSETPPALGAGAVHDHIGETEISRHAEILSRIARSTLGGTGWETDGSNVLKQVCYLPVPLGPSRPSIGRLVPQGSLWVAAGHAVWGILQAPATGEALAAAVLGIKGPPGAVEIADAFPPVKT